MMRTRFAAAVAGRRSFALPLTALGALAAVSFARTAAADTLEVGSGKMYATPCAAISAAKAGDEIDIQAATYNDTCAINTAGLHLKGVGGQPKIDITGVEPAQDKGVYSVQADDVIIENLELTGASISDDLGGNGAGLRIQSNGVQVIDCYIHDNQDGILAGPTSGDGQGTITISHTEFEGNAVGDGCSDGVACTHNVYIGDYAKLIFQFNYSHALNADSPNRGHLLKSRALESDILYNKITQEGSSATSIEVDLPNAGLAIVVGNVIEKGPNAGNPFLLDYGEEGPGTGTNSLYVAYNTFVNDDGGNDTFINIDPRAMPGLGSIHDNIFAGTGTVPAGAAADNVTVSDATAKFADPTTYDYHLTTGSPAVGKAAAAGTAGNFSLTPVFEYVDALGAVSRAAASDVGAFELGTNVTDPSTDAGAESPDGAVSTGTGVGGGGGDAGVTEASGDAGTTGGSTGSGTSGSGTTTGTGTVTVTKDGGTTTGKTDGGANDDSGDSSDGGCAVAGSSDRSSGPFLVGLGVAVAALIRRRRRATR